MPNKTAEQEPNYKEMYHTLLHASEQAIEALEKAKQVLIDSELAAEEIYVSDEKAD